MHLGSPDGKEVLFTTVAMRAGSVSTSGALEMVRNILHLFLPFS